MHFSTLLPIIILVQFASVSGLPIPSHPHETSSTPFPAPKTAPTQIPHLIAKNGVPRKPTNLPSKLTQTISFDPVASALASKLSGIQQQLSRFPIVQPHSTTEGKGTTTTTTTKPTTSTKRRKERLTTTHRTKQHHKTTLEKEHVRPKSSLRIRAVHSKYKQLQLRRIRRNPRQAYYFLFPFQAAPRTSHNIKAVTATSATTKTHTSLPDVIPNPKATTHTATPTSKSKSTPHSTSHHTKTRTTTTEKIAHTTTGPAKVVVPTIVPYPGEPHTGPGRYSPIGEFYPLQVQSKHVEN
ncbi:BQ2448_7882 [Microbotryum intermedium]|uniref:BQ2448_7882 protein n=1 Tax=Microbotryum intermedium TaxID=269621 RepID=A0A238FSB4_9BASI|nr:BQ2448_7882 [Microbotryum intermedium]